MKRLDYIENVDYGQEGQTQQSLLEELAEAIDRDESVEELYEEIRAGVLRELKTSDLAITRIMPDLLRMMEWNHGKAVLVMRLLANPLASYSELGEKMGYSKQRVHVVLHEIAQDCEWLGRLLEIRNEQCP